MQGLYAYCVGKKGQRWSRMKHFSIPITGRSVDLTVVPYRDIEVIVGIVPLNEFADDALRKHLEDEQWLKERVLAHEQVVEEVMRRTPPIVPFKFGTIFRSREKLLAMLKDHYARFHLLLRHFQGRQEWGVKLFSNTHVLLSAIRRADPELRRFTQKMKGQPAGKKYFLEKEFETRLNEMTLTKQRMLAHDLLQALLSCSNEYIENQILPQALTGKEDEMILNVALLVKCAEVLQFQQIIAQWNRTHRKEGFSVERTGPWPPYNFATV